MRCSAQGCAGRDGGMPAGPHSPPASRQRGPSTSSRVRAQRRAGHGRAPIFLGTGMRSCDRHAHVTAGRGGGVAGRRPTFPLPCLPGLPSWVSRFLPPAASPRRQSPWGRGKQERARGPGAGTGDVYSAPPNSPSRGHRPGLQSRVSHREAAAGPAAPPGASPTGLTRGPCGRPGEWGGSLGKVGGSGQKASSPSKGPGAVAGARPRGQVLGHVAMWLLSARCWGRGLQVPARA